MSLSYKRGSGLSGSRRAFPMIRVVSARHRRDPRPPFMSSQQPLRPPPTHPGAQVNFDIDAYETEGDYNNRHVLPSLPSLWHDLYNPEYRLWLLRACLYEFFGTFLMVYIQIISAEVLIAGGGGDVLAHGLAAFIATLVTTHVSGAVLNPSIAVSLWFSQRIDALTVVLYTIMQAAASLMAGGLGLVSVGSLTAGLGLPQLSGTTTYWRAFLIMAIAGAMIFWEFTAAHRHGLYFFYHRHYRFHGSGPMKPVHSALVAWAWYCGMEAAFVTIMGQGPNPARWLGPAVVTGRFHNWTLYVFVPYLGTLFGAMMYAVDETFLKPDTTRIMHAHERETDARQWREQGTPTPRAPKPPNRFHIIEALRHDLQQIFYGSSNNP